MVLEAGMHRSVGLQGRYDWLFEPLFYYAN
jgi:hypothetical protein